MQIVYLHNNKNYKSDLNKHMNEKGNTDMVNIGYLQEAMLLLKDLASKDRVQKNLETQLTESVEYIKQATEEIKEMDLRLVTDLDHIKYVGRTKSTVSLTKGNLYPVVSKNDTEYLITIENTKVINIPFEEAEEVKRLCIIGFKAIDCLLTNPGSKLYDGDGNYLQYINEISGIVKVVDGKETPLVITKTFKDTIWYLQPTNNSKGIKGLLKVLNKFNN